MFKLIQFLILIFNPFLLSPAFSQNIDGLKEIVTIQQEKIARIENNIKNLIGSFESISNSKSMVKVPEDLENKLNTINQKLNLLENSMIRQIKLYTIHVRQTLLQIIHTKLLTQYGTKMLKHLTIHYRGNNHI